MTKKYPLVSIVVPCFNSRDTLQKSLESLLSTEYPNYEVIIVDDVSTDGSFELLEGKFSKDKRIKIIRNENNSGPSKARNTGISLAKGRYIAFYETDMEVEPSWLKYLVSAMERDRRLAAVQSKILDINKRNVIHSMGVLYDPHTFWVYSPGCGYEKGWLPKNLELGIGSVGSLVRKNVIDKIGGFDEMLVHNLDDIELGFRIWLCGYKSRAVPDSITYHWTAKPAKIREKATPSLTSEFHFHKTPRIFVKNYEWRNILRYTPWLFIGFLGRAIYNLIAKKNKAPFSGFIRALIWNVKILPNTLSERKRIQKLRRRSDEKIFEKVGIPGTLLQIYIDKVRPNLIRVQEVFV